MAKSLETSSEERLSNVISSFGISLAVASVVSALLVVAKEKSPAVMASMKSATGHHWSTHSAVAVVIFLAGGGLLTRLNGGRGVTISPARLIVTIVCGIALGVLLIGGYYLVGD